MKSTSPQTSEILKITQDFSGFSPSSHIVNIAQNLALIADVGYGSMTLALEKNGRLQVVAARRTTTAIGPEVKQRVGFELTLDELEAYQALENGATVAPQRTRTINDSEKDITIEYTTSVRPVVEDGRTIGVLICDRARAQSEAPGRMEAEFIKIAGELEGILSHRALVDEDGAPFVTTRRPGDGVLRIDAASRVEYPSPNAVAIMRLAGYESRVRTSHCSELPGGGYAIASVVNKPFALQKEVTVAGRTLLYRTIGLEHGAAVFVEDVTELRRQQQEVENKETIIREVHHRVKNNLQTVTALLRMQARRTNNSETKEALTIAVERINSMAAVHALLSVSEQESLDLGEVAKAVLSSIEASMRDSKAEVTINLTCEQVIILPAHVTTSLALVLTELVHNAYEHGLNIRTDGAAQSGAIAVTITADGVNITLEVADSGEGLPADFDPVTSQNLGLSIVRSIVTKDLAGTLEAFNDHGAHFRVIIPRGESM